MKSIKAFMLVALLVALPALLVSHAGAQTEPALDHFKCWTVVEGRPANDFVLLHDQFNQAGELEPALVRSPIFFCNPTVKIPSTGVVTPILHPDNHLKMYLITTHPDPTTRTVTFSNQFTAAAGQTLTVFQPVILAVPTQKDPHAEPHGLNHFQCYLARGEPINAPVVLQDQFDKQTREAVKVLQPVLSITRHYRRIAAASGGFERVRELSDDEADRLDAVMRQDRSCRQRRHVRPRASAVRHVHRIGNTLETAGAFQHRSGGAGIGRRRLGRQHEVAGAQGRLEPAGGTVHADDAHAPLLSKPPAATRRSRRSSGNSVSSRAAAVVASASRSPPHSTGSARRHSAR